MLAPEYGGDGKAIGVCAQRQAPVAAFPGHWAPNDLAIYHGTRFPEGYRGGAFIAFHGSWNRAPDPQGGYNVVFQPLADGKASGPFVVFADGFAGAVQGSGKGGVPSNRARRRPGRCALCFRRCSWPDLAHHLQWRRLGEGCARAGACNRRDCAWAERPRPRGPILTPAEAPPICRPLPGTLRVRSRSATVSFMARRATARAADVTGRTPAAARSGQRSIQAIGCGATAAFRGSLRRSRAASRIPSNIRASCRHWAALRFRRTTWPRWRHMFGPSAMPESHEASHDLTPPL